MKPDKITDFARQSTDEICQAMEKKNSKQVPPVIVIPVKFRRYPQEKPEKSNSYYLIVAKHHNGEISTQSEFWHGSRWDALNDCIIAFAYLPEVNLDAEEFDFSTAVVLAKDGITCVSVVSGDILDKDSVNSDTWFDMFTILGKWRLAE